MMQKRRSREQRIYEILGVRVFRLLVFRLEKLIHRKDKGHNANYHITSFETQSVDAFIKYLFYNGAIHVRNIVWLIALLAVKYIVLRWVSPWDVLLWAVLLKDCYCVMLQRYNYLRIQSKSEKLKHKREIRIQTMASEICAAYDDDETRERDLAFIQKLRYNIQKRESVFISEDDALTLVRLKGFLDTASG